MSYEPVGVDDDGADVDWQQLALPDIEPDVAACGADGAPAAAAVAAESSAVAAVAAESSAAVALSTGTVASSSTALGLPQHLAFNVEVHAHQQRPDGPPVIDSKKDFRCELRLRSQSNTTAQSAIAGSADAPPPQTVRFRISVALQMTSADGQATSSSRSGGGPQQQRTQHTPLDQLRASGRPNSKESSPPPLLLLRGITELDVPVDGPPVTTLLRMGIGVTSHNYRRSVRPEHITLHSSYLATPSGELAQFCLLIEPMDPAIIEAHPHLARFTQPAFQVITRLRPEVRSGQVAKRSIREAGSRTSVASEPLADRESVEPEEECCPICFEEFASCSHLETRAPGGWGHTRCCDQPLHYACLYKWINDNSMVDSSSGPVALDTGCPLCRSNVSKSKFRMLGPVRKVAS